MRLCRDEDAEVRMAAVSMMGTIGDPRLLSEVEAMARQDSDARIRDLADQIGDQRDMAGDRGGSRPSQSHAFHSGTFR